MLLWVHDADWAVERFRTVDAENFGLCGAFKVGLSKFVSATDSFPASKEAALDALGLKGYAAFDKPGTLYVVQAKLSPDIFSVAAPAVPLLYQLGHNDDRTASKPSSWAPAPSFQEGTVPGYTSGLRCELVMNTFKMAAASVEDLRDKGLQCIALDD
eukprot:gnl/TRDRNA2_/TRDRNA2_90175_c0_seq2.p2 gnl/TRDRNA2_/TRDRNA2_90175_c0~~gnl/TRDRNA2_/TRDRNA2_90175_c0_seq2.p2  ORF type:complete len:157 (+),score=38.49 gnl/TRDRNA2_/TRDRNA2_90175_c0_seq2:431-901(+)